MKSLNDDILYDIDNSINNELAKHRIQQEKEKLDYEKQYYIKEIGRLNNIINELEKDIDLELYKTRANDDYNNGLFNAFRYIKDKLQELKGDSSNV